MALKVVAITSILLVALAHIECTQMAAGIGRESKNNQPSEVESAVLEAQAAPESKQEESYQRVYDAFTRLMQNVSNNSLGNVRRLVSRLNQLVGGSGQPAEGSGKVVVVSPPGTEQKRTTSTATATTDDERTEQILNRLDKVNKETDQHSLRQLNEDINKLVGTLNESYLRNLRRVIERVNRLVGQQAIEVPSSRQPAPGAIKPSAALHQSGTYVGEDPNKPVVPGFPGWDELLVAMDRMQKSLAQVVRSSTKLITGTG